VLSHLRRGATNADIATELGVSPDAVKYHVSNMLGKLELESREELAAWREPALPKRAWAALPAAGWKLAVLAGSGAAVIAVGLVGFLLLRPEDDASKVGSGSLFIGTLTGLDGQPPDGAIMAPAISSDGRFVAFESDATNLVPDDKNGKWDIFVFDRLTRETRRVSVSTSGGEANGDSHRPAISGDGRFVAFDSVASNLIPNDANGDLGVAVALVPPSLAQLFNPPGFPSRDRVAAAQGIAGSDVFVVDLRSGDIELVSKDDAGTQGNLGSFAPSISADGRMVAFESGAPNLQGLAVARNAPGPGVSQFLAEDIFVRDRRAGTTRMISGPDSQSWFGSGLAAISPDGESVAFATQTFARCGHAQLVAICLWDAKTGQLSLVPPPPAPQDADGNVFVSQTSRPALAFHGDAMVIGLTASAPRGPAGDSDEVRGAFLWRPGETKLRPIPGTELQGNSASATASFSDDGRQLMVTTNGLSVAILDLTSSAMRNVSLPVDSVYLPVMSGNAEWIAGLHERSSQRSPSGFPLLDLVIFPTH
jgi:hypothetical protein